MPAFLHLQSKGSILSFAKAWSYKYSLLAVQTMRKFANLVSLQETRELSWQAMLS